MGQSQNGLPKQAVPVIVGVVARLHPPAVTTHGPDWSVFVVPIQ